MFVCLLVSYVWTGVDLGSMVWESRRLYSNPTISLSQLTPLRYTTIHFTSIDPSFLHHAPSPPAPADLKILTVPYIPKYHTMPAPSFLPSFLQNPKLPPTQPPTKNVETGRFPVCTVLYSNNVLYRYRYSAGCGYHQPRDFLLYIMIQVKVCMILKL